MYSYGPSRMAEQKQDGQLELTYSSSVRIWDVALKTCQRRWTTRKSGERGLGISVQAAPHDDDDGNQSRKRKTSNPNQLHSTQTLTLCSILVAVCYVMTFDLAPKNAIPRWRTGRKWHIPMAFRRGNRVGGNWLMKWTR